MTTFSSYLASVITQSISLLKKIEMRPTLANTFPQLLFPKSDRLCNYDYCFVSKT